MLRPIDGEGTSRYSTGRPGLENAPAVAEPPTTPMRPVNRAAPTAATASRRGATAVALRNLRISFKNDIASTHPNFHRFPVPHCAVESVLGESNTGRSCNCLVAAVAIRRGWLTIQSRVGLRRPGGAIGLRPWRFR